MKYTKNILLAMMLLAGIAIQVQAATYYEPETTETVCQRDLPYIWRDKPYTVTGTYHDTAIVEQPVTDTVIVDTTIYTLNLTVMDKMVERTIELRKGSRVEIRGIWYDQPGTYYDTVPSSTGCDSVLRITIIWAESYRQIEPQEICEGNSIVWHGKTLSEEGIYWDSLKTVQGYDSVFQLHLTVHHPFVDKDTITMCINALDSFQWHGRWIKEAGDYQRVYIDHYGCDSTYNLHMVTTASSPDLYLTTYFCRNQGFEWRGKKYFEQKTFVDSLHNVAGCDSVVYYRYIPRNNDFHSDLVQHYAGDPIVWREKTYTIDSIYQDTLVNQYGCDSIIELRLVTKYDLDRSIIRCQGDTAMFNGEIIRVNCDRNDTLKTILGGDSILHYHFSFADPFYSREYITLCSNEYFEWTGHYDKNGKLMVLHEEGSYYDRHRNAAGCDSTYEVIVKHSPAYLHDSIVIICNDSNDLNPISWTDSKGYTWTFHKHNIDTTICDTMRHTLPVEQHYTVGTDDFVPISGGCDSIFRFRVIITDRCSELDSIPMCKEDKSVQVDGRIYTEPGLYSNKMPSKLHPDLNLPDSTHTFRIWMAPSDTSFDTVIVCESKLPYIYTNGQKFTKHQSGDYAIHFSNRYGCDSLVNLHIDIIPTIYSPINVYNNFCPGEAIHVETPTGKIFTKPGEYTDTVPYGVEYEWDKCDSIIRYRIEYKQGFFHSETHYLGVDSAFKWEKHHGDTVYTQAGIFYDSCKNVYGCDSVYQLRLIYAQPFYQFEEEHLCTNQLPYPWHKQSINTEGVFYDSLRTVYGLDSVYQINITIDSVFRDTIVKNFCHGDYFELNGKVITTSGQYDYVLHTSNACDSIITYIVNFMSAIVKYPEVVHLPEGSSYTWHGRTFDKAGTYFDTIPSKRLSDAGHPCDSIVYSLQLLIEHSFYKEESPISVCSNHLPLIWHGKNIQKAGEYYDSLKTIYMMDSVYKVVVTIDSAYNQTKVYHLCDGDAFNLRGKYHTTSGEYVDTLVSTCGCDSIIHHIVNFTTSAVVAQETLHCEEGQSVIWHGKEYNKEGLYFDTLRNEWGCDSVRYSMRLIIDHAFFQSDSVALCPSELPYSWHKRELQTAGIYWDSCKTIYGLDSVYRFKLDTLPSSFYSYNQFICKGSSYNFGTQVITEPGVYVNHLLKTNGCDSTIRCVVNYAKQYFYGDEVITYVDDSELPIIWHGKELNHEGYFYDSLTTVEYGCDSIHRVLLRKSQSYFFNEPTVEICDSRLPYLWHGQSLVQSGTYKALYVTHDGQDSIYQMTLVVYPSDSTTINASICPGETYQLYGKTYSQPGVYRDTMFTEEGCYNIIKLHLNFYDVSTSDMLHLLCPGDSLSINGKTISQSGVYTETTKSHITGCDSIIRHIVSYNTSFYQSESKIINPGDVYIWHKDGAEWALSETGVYFDSCKNQFGCDSVYRLDLVVNQVEYHFPVEVVNYCENALPYVWHNMSFYNDTLVTANYKTRLGRDSIYTLQLRISRAKDSLVYETHCEGDRPEINGKVFTRSAQFVDTVSDIYGCDSVRIFYTLNFYPRYSLTKLISLRNGETYLFGDTVIATSGTYDHHFTTVNGCDSLVTLIVEACETSKDTIIRKDLCEGETFTLNGEDITKSGKYYSYLKTADGCDSIVTYLVNFHPSFNQFNAVSICRGEHYTWTGHLGDTVLTKAGTYVDSIPTESGCYNTYTLKLSYKNQEWRDTLISLCEDKLPYRYKGKNYYVDTVFNDTLGNNINGCDSILRWHYEINHHCSPYSQYQRCTNETLYIDGLLIDHAGAFAVNMLTTEGEDSIHRFVVHDAQPYETYVTLDPACDSIVYNGNIYRARQENQTVFQREFKFKSVDKCDSVVHVTFTIYKTPPTYTEYATIADYETYRFEGSDYKTSGTFVKKYTDQHLCDSIRELVLTVLTTQHDEPIHYAFCKGDRTGLYIFGKMYYPTTDTVISDTIRVGNTPTIRTAMVHMNMPFTITSFDPLADQLVCSSAQEVWFDVNYTAKDQEALPQTYDIDFISSDLDGYPQHATYTVNSPTSLSIKMDGRGKYINPGTYTYRITFRTDFCTYSDTAFTGSVTINYPAEIMKGKWDDVVTLLNADYNGGEWDLQPPFEWLVKDKDGRDKTAAVAPSNSAQPYIASNRLANGDQIQVLTYRAGYTKPVWSCPYIFESNGPATQAPIVVYPTVVKKTSSVHIDTDNQGAWKLFNTTGNKYTQGNLIEGTNQIQVPNTTGCYLLQVNLDNGEHHLERIIIY